MHYSVRHLISLVLSIATLVGCGARNEALLNSPSGKYATLATVQDSIVYVQLHSKEGKELHEVRSGASEYQKWAIGWMPEHDTVVLYSADFGTLAYEVVGGRLLRIEDVQSDSALVQRGQELYANKYN